MHWTPDAIRALRRTLRLGQMQLAAMLGAHFFTVQKWERGYNAPSPAYARMLDELARRGDRPPMP